MSSRYSLGQRLLLGACGAGGVAAAAAHVWARHVEIHRFTLRRVQTAVLPQDSPALQLLHISDIHLMPEQERKRAFLRSLGKLNPDVVVNTGDNISAAPSIPLLAQDLEPLLHVPGAFVMGSNDLYAPERRNPLRYFLPDPRPEGFASPERERSLPTDELAQVLSSGGWRDLTNRRDSSPVGDLQIEWVGVDDPHLERDTMPPPEAHSTADGALPHGRTTVRIGVAHAPYRRVLDALVEDGCDLILAGHTHGGQLRIPGIGALVTNCDLPRSQAKGLSSWRGVPLHVSGGLGANPYTNYRFANPPEATLVTLLPRQAS